MALLFTDGFERYNTGGDLTSARYYAASAMPGRWSGYQGAVPSLTSVAFRTTQPAGTSRSINFNVGVGANYYAVLSTPACGTVIAGFAFYVSNRGGGAVVRFGSPSTASYHTGGNFVSLGFTASGQVTLYNNRTATYLITSAASIVNSSQWHYGEVKISFGASGSAEVRIDGVSVGTATSVDTRSHTSDSSFTGISYGFGPSSAGGDAYFDDLYVCDDTGGSSNTFLGPIAVYTVFPTANGSTIQLTPVGVANNWDAVNEQNFETATYVSSSVVNNKDQYVVTDLPGGISSVVAVAVGSVGSKSETNPRQYRHTLTVGGTTSYGATITPMFNSYYSAQDLFALTPGGSAWTVADVNSMEIGVEVL